LLYIGVFATFLKKSNFQIKFHRKREQIGFIAEMPSLFQKLYPKIFDAFVLLYTFILGRQYTHIPFKGFCKIRIILKAAKKSRFRNTFSVGYIFRRFYTAVGVDVVKNGLGGYLLKNLA